MSSNDGSASRPGFPAPGELLGPFRIVRQLGVGGMGVVFEAVDEGLDRRVALKVISPHLADDPSFRARFTREAKAQASLDSRHVVSVYAYGEADGSLYLATQLIPDGDLGALINKGGTPPPGIAIDVIAQVAAGLADAHRVGLVHRDIKPGNVLVRIRGNEVSAYLADFGIARRADGDNSLTQQGFAVGTPTYMAPEIHTDGTFGPASDIYALGCLLWAALTGRAPYSGTTDYQLVSQHLSAPIPQLDETGAFAREVNRVLRTAMAKRPTERYPSSDAFADDLRRVGRTCEAPSAVRAAGGPIAAAAGAVGTPGTPSGGAPTSPPPPSAPPAAPRTVTGRTPSGGMGASSGHYAAYQPGYPGGGAPSGTARSGGRGPLLVLAALAAVLVLVGATIGVVALLSDDDEPGGGGAGGNGSSSEPTDENGLTEREQQAVANLTESLAADGSIDRPTSACLARELVANEGLDALIEAGLLTDDLQVVDGGDGEADPELLTKVLTYTVTCVWESVSIDLDQS